MATDLRTAATAATGTWGVLRGTLASWLGWRGLVRLVLWVGAINGFLYFTVVTKNQPFGGIGFESLMNMLALFPVLAGIIAAESTVLGEHRSGVAAWTVSKPVPRAGYVAGKLTGLWLGLSASALLIPGLVAYWWLPHVTPYRFVRPEAPPLGRFLGALAVLSLVVAAFIAFTALLATLLRRRGAVALIALIAYINARIPQRALWDDWDRYTPSGLISHDVTGWSQVTDYLHGAPFTATTAVVWTAIAAAVFVAGSVVMYRRLEL